MAENQDSKDSLIYKIFLKKYAVFLGISCFMIGILIYSIYAAKASWKNNLRVTIEKVLEENEPNTWSIENYSKIQNALGMSAVCYEGRNRKNGEIYKIVLIRIATFYGPLPAVFTVSEDKEVTFIGYSSVHGQIAAQLQHHIKNNRINYWKNQILEIIK